MAKKQLVRNKWFNFTVSVSKNQPRIKTFEKLFRIKESSNSFLLKIDSNQRIKKQSFRFTDSNQWIKNQHFWIIDSKQWIKKQLFWFVDSNQWIKKQKFWITDSNQWIKKQLFWILDSKQWIKNQKFWITVSRQEAIISKLLMVFLFPVHLSFNLDIFNPWAPTGPSKKCCEKFEGLIFGEYRQVKS